MPHRNGAGIALLADPTRRRLIAALAIRPAQPSTLADLLELSRFTVSRQLRLLRDAGLVVDHRLLSDGRGVLYTINARRHGAITAWLAGTDVGATIDPAAAAGIPLGRRAANDPWRAYRLGPRSGTDAGSQITSRSQRRIRVMPLRSDFGVVAAMRNHFARGRPSARCLRLTATIPIPPLEKAVGGRTSRRRDSSPTTVPAGG